MKNFYKKLALVITTFAMFTFIATSQTTIVLPLTTDYDDAEEWLATFGGETAGKIDATSSDLEVNFDGAPQAIGIIFRNATIPKGATITNTFIQFTVDEIHPGQTDVATPPFEIYGVKEAKDATPFSTTPFDVTSRPKTTAKVTNWLPGPSVAEGDAGVNERTPDLKAIVQELVNQAAWTSGNSITIVITGDPGVTTNATRFFEADITSSPGGEATLSVTYTGVGVEDVYGSSVSMYPNPTTGRFTIKNPSAGKFGYAIYNVIGKVVKSRDDIAGASAEVDMTSSAKGTYFVEVKSDAKTLKSKLILK